MRHLVITGDGSTVGLVGVANLDPLDPEIPLNVGTGKAITVSDGGTAALNNSFGVRGPNVTLASKSI